MDFSQLKQKVYLHFIFKIIIYIELFEKSELFLYYQFLGEILNLYDKLDQPVVENDQYQDVLILCDKASSLPSDPRGVYKNFCKKLSRNLLLLNYGGYGGGDYFKYCDILYMWMYFEIKKNSISNEITQNFFNESSEIIKPKLIKSSCSYFNFNEKNQEPTKLMKLRIFEYNISIFKNTLNDINALNNCSCLKYIYECINIYKGMHRNYCFG
ncbi:hypothetical protein PVMG_04518 [Plasmodium vivax Mauritania I]|uniref:Uncharacterized protein n=1 Tax=Plasmodium vivax Mauritania I TaxID=1035515 RepID=A0A0J9VQP7_PLAVI|nr:hypothetical protein PVMG_04518 [Plasmodium vivax Mauritania I]